MDFGEWEKIVNHTLIKSRQQSGKVHNRFHFAETKKFQRKNITAKKFILISFLNFKNAMRAFAEA